MKLTWQQWTALAIAGASVIAEIVLVFVNPTAAVFTGIAFVLGGLCGYLAVKKGVVNATAK